jgi:hypothetical protein
MMMLPEMAHLVNHGAEALYEAWVHSGLGLKAISWVMLSPARLKRADTAHLHMA